MVASLCAWACGAEVFAGLLFVLVAALACCPGMLSELPSVVWWNCRVVCVVVRVKRRANMWGRLLSGVIGCCGVAPWLSHKSESGVCVVAGCGRARG
eukprot:9472895-Pyramimonas_sp.AAC.1